MTLNQNKKVIFITVAGLSLALQIIVCGSCFYLAGFLKEPHTANIASIEENTSIEYQADRAEIALFENIANTLNLLGGVSMAAIILQIVSYFIFNKNGLK